MTTTNERRAFWNAAIALGPAIFGAILAIGAIIAIRHPLPYLFVPLCLYVIGIYFFLKAKLSVIKHGALVSFGPHLMTPTNRRLYKVGYSLMGLATLLVLAFLSTTH